MAVGIIQIPSLYEPAFNPNWFVVSGSNTASGNYKLMARVHVPSGTIVAKLKQPTRPDFPFGTVFDVRRIIESYVTETVDIAANQVTNAPNNIVEYLVEFGEEYGTTPAEYWTGVYQYPCYGLNIALSPKEFNAYNYLDYLTASTSRKWLNKYKGTRKVFSTTKAFLYFLSDQDNDVDRIAVAAYDSAGNQIGSTAKILTNVTGAVKYVPAGPANLNLIPSGKLTAGTAGSLVPANASYYDVWMEYSSAQVSEKLRFSVVENCSKYTNYPIYFKGQFGNVEVQNFSRRSDKLSDILKQDFKKGLGKFLDAFGHWGYEDTDRQTTTYNTEVTDSVTLNTDYLTEAEYEFLKECVQSPVVWSLEDGVMIPVSIKDSQFTWKKKVNDKLFNLSITIQYASTLELQRA